MQIIVDANPIISMLIKPGKVIDLLFIQELDLVCPELLFEELERNKKEIVNKSRLTAYEINRFLKILKKRIKLIPEEEFVKFKKKAEEICPDKKDIAYFALAMHLNVALWSNDKKLKQQEEVKVYATHELMKLLRIS